MRLRYDLLIWSCSVRVVPFWVAVRQAFGYMGVVYISVVYGCSMLYV